MLIKYYPNYDFSLIRIWTYDLYSLYFRKEYDWIFLGNCFLNFIIHTIEECIDVREYCYNEQKRFWGRGQELFWKSTYCASVKKHKNTNVLFYLDEILANYKIHCFEFGIDKFRSLEKYTFPFSLFILVIQITQRYYI